MGLFRVSVLTFVWKLTVSGLGLLNSVLLARLNSTLNFGLYQTSASFNSVPTNYMGGYAGYYSYALAKRSKDSASIIQMGNLFICGACTLFLAMVLALRHVLFSHIPFVWWWACLTIPFSVSFNYGTKLLQGLGEISWLNRVNALQPFVLFVLAGAVFLDRQSLTTSQRLHMTYVVWLVSFASSACFTLFLVYRLVRHERGVAKWQFHLKEWNGTIRYGTWMSVSNTVNIVNYRTDFWFVIAYFPSLTSQYSIAVTASEVLLQVSGSISSVVFKSMTGGSRQDSIRITETSTRHTLISSLIVAIPMAVFFPWLISSLYGTRYMGAIVPFLILLPGLIFKAAGNVIIQYATNQLRSPIRSIWMNGICAAINAICCVVLVPEYRAVGAAIASSISYVICFGVYVAWFARVNGVSAQGMLKVKKSDLFAYVTPFRRILSKART